MSWNERARARMGRRSLGGAGGGSSKWARYTLGELAVIARLEPGEALNLLLEVGGADREGYRRAHTYLKEEVRGDAEDAHIETIIDVAGLRPADVRTLVLDTYEKVQETRLRAGRGLSGAGSADTAKVTVYSRDGSKNSWETPLHDAIREAQEETRWENTKRVVVTSGGKKLFDEEGDYAGFSGASGEASWPSDYTHFVVSNGAVESGWEYKEDAKDRADEIREFEGGKPKVLTRTGVNRGGYSWGTP